MVGLINQNRFLGRNLLGLHTCPCQTVGMIQTHQAPIRGLDLTLATASVHAQQATGTVDREEIARPVIVLAILRKLFGCFQRGTVRPTPGDDGVFRSRAC